MCTLAFVAGTISVPVLIVLLARAATWEPHQ
jgi:hypothetical protein